MMMLDANLLHGVHAIIVSAKDTNDEELFSHMHAIQFLKLIVKQKDMNDRQVFSY